jgi:hypothetical protein
MEETVIAHAVEAAVRYRLLLTLAAARHMGDSWKTLATVSDQDVDRAAVTGRSLPRQAPVLSLPKLQAVLLSHLAGSPPERVDALWALMDRDQDGMLDEDEMNKVCEMAVQPVRMALERFFREAVEAYSVLMPLPPLDDSRSLDGLATKGWSQRRRERKAKNVLMQMFQRALRRHFVDEVEMPHRLRCIYAWAGKSHQNNSVDSVLVDEAGWSGRKRYVELNPKISLPEFREVQREHFAHLDRVGEEFLQSFREDLLILQGKGRQRHELIRDCSLFLAGVCSLDFLISSL